MNRRRESTCERSDVADRERFRPSTGRAGSCGRARSFCQTRSRGAALRARRGRSASRMTGDHQAVVGVGLRWPRCTERCWMISWFGSSTVLLSLLKLLADVSREHADRRAAATNGRKLIFSPDALIRRRALLVERAHVRFVHHAEMHGRVDAVSQPARRSCGERRGREWRVPVRADHGGRRAPRAAAPVQRATAQARELVATFASAAARREPARPRARRRHHCSRRTF